MTQSELQNVGDNRAELLNQAMAIATGQLPVPDHWKPALSGQVFNHLWHGTLASFPEQELEIILHVANLATRAMCIMREHKGSTRTELLKSAEEMLLQCRKLFHGQGSLALAHCLSIEASVRAYLAYSRENWSDVERALAEVNAADLTLMENGYEIMHAHRVQTLHNWARAKVRQCGIPVGLVLADLIEAHLFGQSISSVPLVGPWHGDLIEHLPNDLVGAIVVQVAGERNYWRYRQTQSDVAAD